LIIIFSIYFIGQQKGLFRQVFHISSIFKDVKGLKVGSNVRFSGINIGTVNNITMLNSYEVKVDFIIDKDVRKFIKMDAVAIIELHESSENVTFITKNLVDITDKINNGEGVFGKLFTDTTITKNLDIISYNTAELTNNIAHITKNIDEEKGLLGKLLSDTAYINKFEYTISDITSSANNINIASKNLIGITDKINNGKGMFGKVFTDTTFIENLAMSGKNINIASENLAKITKNINSGDGIINKLLTDSTLTDSLKITLYNLNKGIKEIDAAAKSIKGNWFIRAFSKNDKKEELEDTTKN
jgi:phospholipid/cholesterol/gamma-HCH transport system substrate-binding protein